MCACTKCLLIVTSTQGYNPHVWGHGTLASYWLLWEISARGYILMYGGMTYGPRVYVCHFTILARKRYAARTKPKLSFIFHCLGSSTMSRVRFMNAVTGEELHLPPRISTSIRARRVRTVIYKGSTTSYLYQGPLEWYLSHIARLLKRPASAIRLVTTNKDGDSCVISCNGRSFTLLTRLQQEADGNVLVQVVVDDGGHV